MRRQNPIVAAGAWLYRTVESICNRPDHLQRLAIIGAGMSIYPAVAILVGIAWKGYDRTPELQSQSLGIIGISLYILLALFGLVIVTLLGTIKGLSISGPGGMGVEINTTADDPDVDPSTERTPDTVIERGGRGRGRDHGMPGIAVKTPSGAITP